MPLPSRNALAAFSSLSLATDISYIKFLFSIRHLVHMLLTSGTHQAHRGENAYEVSCTSVRDVPLWPTSGTFQRVRGDILYEV